MLPDHRPPALPGGFTGEVGGVVLAEEALGEVPVASPPAEEGSEEEAEASAPAGETTDGEEAGR